jgi:hypothetical protein
VSAFTSFAAGSPANQNNAYQALGYNANGSKTTITATGVNGKGAYAVLGTTSSAWSGFWLVFGQGSASTARYLIDISIGATGSEVVLVPNFYAEPNQTVAPLTVFIPLNVATGVQLSARCQSSSSGATMAVAVVGVATNADSAPLFSTMAALTADTANTRISTTNVTLVGSGSTTYTSLVDPTSTTYGALLWSIGQSGTTPATSQEGRAAILTSPTGGGGEAEAFAGGVFMLATSTVYKNPYYLTTKQFASGIRISGQVIAGTPGTDTIRFGLYGFS